MWRRERNRPSSNPGPEVARICNFANAKEKNQESKKQRGTIASLTLMSPQKPQWEARRDPPTIGMGQIDEIIVFFRNHC
jgi:hypothetical protein